MADTLYTSDGKLHVLIGSTSFSHLIREYMGNEAAGMVEELEKNDAYERARADSDMDAYEASLEHLHRQIKDWVDSMREMVSNAQYFPRRYPRTKLMDFIQELGQTMNKEL